MRIVVWNVARRGGAVLGAVRDLEPDVAVVPECAATLPLGPGECMVWCGRDPRAGLAVVGFGGRRVRRVGRDPLPHEWVMPVRVEGPGGFGLLAVWATMSGAHLRATRASAPAGPVREALRTYRTSMRRGPWVVGGDFNNGVRWDRPLAPTNHGNLVADLASLGLVSAYHRLRRCDFGAEPEPTFHLRRAADRGDHIDYCFVPRSWTVDAVEVGTYERYCAPGRASDHAPLVVDCRPGGDCGPAGPGAPP